VEEGNRCVPSNRHMDEPSLSTCILLSGVFTTARSSRAPRAMMEMDSRGSEIATSEPTTVDVSMIITKEWRASISLLRYSRNCTSVL